MAIVISRVPRPAFGESAAVLAMVACSAIVAAAALAGGAAAFTAILGLALVVAIVIQPRIGLYAATLLVVLFSGLASNPAFGDQLVPMGETVPGVGLFPIEIVLLAALVGIVRSRVFEEGYRLRAGDIGLPLALFVGAVGLSFLYGIATGGDFRIAFWETRGIAFVAVTYVVVVNTLRTRQDMTTFANVAIAGALLMSIEAVYRHLVYIRPGYTLDEPLDLAFIHEASLVAALAAVLLICRMLWGDSAERRIGYGMLALIPLAALMVMKRRAGIIALDVAVVLLAISLFRHDRIRFLMIVPIAMVFVAALLALTWNNPGGSGQFARGVQSITDQTSSKPTQAGEDQSSDEYRRRETANARANILARPVQGLGFGKPYDMPNQLPDLSSFWPFFAYIPHNTVLWLWIKGGIVSFLAFVTLVGAAMMRAGQLFVRFRGDPMQVAAITAGLGIAMFTTFAYVDLGLTSPIATVFFGVMLGILASLAALVRDEDAAQVAP